VALAQTAGRIVLRASEADVLPLRATDFSDTIAQYVDEMHKLADDRRESTEAQHRLLDEKLYTLASDPTKAFALPERDASVPVLNLAPLDNALLRLKKSAKSCDDARASAMKAELKLSVAQRLELDSLLRSLEQTLTNPQGLPGRDWFQHMIYAPGLKTGYGVKTLPGVREGIEDRRWPDAEHFAVVIADSLGAYCDQLDKITALLKSGG